VFYQRRHSGQSLYAWTARTLPLGLPAADFSCFGITQISENDWEMLRSDSARLRVQYRFVVPMLCRSIEAQASIRYWRTVGY
jgi:hypothetical protein